MDIPGNWFLTDISNIFWCLNINKLGVVANNINSYVTMGTSEDSHVRNIL